MAIIYFPRIVVGGIEMREDADVFNADVLAADNADVLAADNADVLAADTTDVLAADITMSPCSCCKASDAPAAPVILLQHH